jgi:hypothetical protein
MFKIMTKEKLTYYMIKLVKCNCFRIEPNRGILLVSLGPWNLELDTTDNLFNNF